MSAPSQPILVRHSTLIVCTVGMLSAFALGVIFSHVPFCRPIPAPIIEKKIDPDPTPIKKLDPPIDVHPKPDLTPEPAPQPCIGQVLGLDTSLCNLSSYTLEVQQVVDVSGKLVNKTITLHCGAFCPTPGPTPKPLPTPDPLPRPDPPQPTPPQPVYVKVSVVTIENPKHRTPETAIFLENMRTWTAFSTAGNVWQNFDIAGTTPEAKEASAYIASKGIAPPAWIIKDKTTNAVLHCTTLPPDSERETTVEKYTGDIP